MPGMMRRDFPLPFTELVEWLEAPLTGWRAFGHTIKVEDYVEDDHYVVRAELPGIDPDKDVEIMVGGGVLTIRAERAQKVEEPNRTEFRYGSLYRSIPLPATVKEDDVTARYTAGVLEVRIGLTEKKPPGRRIPVDIVK